MKNLTDQSKESTVVTERMRRQIAGAMTEVDLAQLAVLRQLTPAQRVWQAVSMIEAAEGVAVHRLRQREPELSEEEALRIVRRGLINYYTKPKTTGLTKAGFHAE